MSAGWFRRVRRSFAFQFFCAFAAIQVLMSAAGLAAIYGIVSGVLAEDARRSMESQMLQGEYNISILVEDADLLSRTMIIDATFSHADEYERMSAGERADLSASMLRKMGETLLSSRYLSSILYYADNGLAVKRTQSQSLVEWGKGMEAEPVYAGILSDAKAARQKLIIRGGLSESAWGLGLRSQAQSRRVISAIRYLTRSSQAGTLILNIDEAYFTSVYNQGFGASAISSYVTDEAGLIISAGDKDLIGTRSGAFTHLDREQDSAYAEFSRGGEKYMTLSRRLPIAKGYLISEVSFRAFRGDIDRIQWIHIATFVITSLLSFLLAGLLVKRLTRPLLVVSHAFEKVRGGELGYQIGKIPENELGRLAENFNAMSQEIKAAYDAQRAYEREKRKLEIQALRSQIDPHFIYNTLNTIRWMAIIAGAKNIAKCTDTFASFLKPAFASQDAIGTLADEIKMIHDYLEIINYRYAGGYELEVDVGEEYLNTPIVRFALQPIVENAFKYGFSGRSSGTVGVRARSDGGRIAVDIEDDGAGMDAGELDRINELLALGEASTRESVGLLNVNRRIRLHFGSDYGVRLYSREGGGIRAAVFLPRAE